jgi:hypothetical protein
MRDRIRRLFVLAVALALIGSAFGRSALSATPRQPCHEHAHHASTHDHDPGNAGHALHHQHHDGASEKSPGGQTCDDCCAVCTIATTALLVRPSAEAVIAATPIVYVINPETYRERPVVIDPGIPKATA